MISFQAGDFNPRQVIQVAATREARDRTSEQHPQLYMQSKIRLFFAASAG
jgi:hypothetical protein